MRELSIKKRIIFWLMPLLIPPIMWLLIDLFATKIFLKFETQNIYPRISSHIFHHTLANNVDVIEDNARFGKTKLITNSIGFRDKEVRKISKETSKYRMVFIGDSMTEGFLLNYEESFVGIIDNKLKDYNIEVLNAAVVSYSPSIYYAKIKHYLDKNYKFDEIIVYLDLTDIFNEATEDRLKLAKTRDLSIQRGYSPHVAFLKKNLVITYKVLNFIFDWIYVKKRNTAIHDEAKLDEFILGVVSGKTYTKDNWTVNKEMYKKYENGINKSLRYMGLLKDLCDENNIKLTMAVFPHPTQIYHNDLDSLQVKIWKKFSEENIVDFINYFPYFIDKKLSLEQRVNVIKRNFIPFDIHFNAEGSKIMANIFLEKFIPSIENRN